VFAQRSHVARRTGKLPCVKWLTIAWWRIRLLGSFVPREARAARARLRGSVVRYDQPLDPAVDPAEWQVNR
jgi:hypothetical protein